MTGTTYGIVAGYDGSPGAAQALRWAAREARARDSTLTVSLAWTPDHIELPTELDLCDLARQHGREILPRGLQRRVGTRTRPGGRRPRRVAARQPAPRAGRVGRGRLPGRLGGSRQVEEDFDQLVAVEAKEHPEVSVVRHVLAGTPRAALLTASAGAQLLVVGARGRGGLDEMSLGSIALAVLQYAPCPVGVVHQASPPLS